MRYYLWIGLFVLLYIGFIKYKTSESFVIPNYTDLQPSGYSFIGTLNNTGLTLLTNATQTGINSSYTCSFPNPVYVPAPTPPTSVITFCNNLSNLSTYYPSSKSVSIDIGTSTVPNIIQLPPNTSNTCIWDIMYNKNGITPSLSILTSGSCDLTDPNTPLSISTDTRQSYACHQQIWRSVGCTQNLPPYDSQLSPSPYGWATGYLNNTNGVQGVTKQWLYDDAKLRSTMPLYDPICYGRITTSIPKSTSYFTTSDGYNGWGNPKLSNTYLEMTINSTYTVSFTTTLSSYQSLLNLIGKKIRIWYNPSTGVIVALAISSNWFSDQFYQKLYRPYSSLINSSLNYSSNYYGCYINNINPRDYILFFPTLNNVYNATSFDSPFATSINKLLNGTYSSTGWSLRYEYYGPLNSTATTQTTLFKINVTGSVIFPLTSTAL
jgi:hypothetical protein